MCGIAGIADRRGLDPEMLIGMRDTMIHRGPDDAGLWMSRDKTVGLAHRRLSIIDLSDAGRQPMSDREGKIWITFNGEIYNFQEIHEQLTKKGYAFKSRSDTEVIINAYKEWGTDCISKFNGMFAFGIYDDNRKILFLARDRIGKKPLYYTLDKRSGGFAFSSEIKALLRIKDISREFDLQALNSYLTFGYVPGEMSIFQAIRKLLPAHAMIYNLDNGEHKIWSYWDVPRLAEKIPSEEELLETLETLLTDAVRIRMISDVPLGAFLSGGVDSSLVVALMSKISSRPVKTFSIGFENNAHNELPYARIVADHFGTEHHELIVKPDAFSVLPDLVRQFDEPFADSSMIPAYYVSKVTREHVAVALSGDGGDEIFGGYTVYLAGLFDYYARMLVPSFLREGLAGAAKHIPDDTAGRIKKQMLLLKLDLHDVFVERYTRAFFDEPGRRNLLNKDITRSLESAFTAPELSRRSFLGLRNKDFITSMTYADLKTYLPDDVMVKVDRAGMMVSLETRAPLLDYRIAEFSFGNIPGNLKVKQLTTKYILKKLAKKLLPEELDIKRKWGFSVPISDWFSGPLKSHVREVLMGDKSEYFNHSTIKQLLDEQEHGIDHSARLFNLLVFSLWKREYLGSG
ncbi:MAG: asparagine synthase (glutamine-hydrolyzing) [Thermodesulfovibrionia bacterium]|nr:asparagine synthase (glutamine-hydrolyzing) [Thermodesulfovibrionia bacterium]